MARILIVDDEPMILRIMQVALEDRGYTVTSAQNGEQALAILESMVPDAVITDIDMPRMNGQQLCVTLRERFTAEQLPLFIVTAKTAVEHRDWSTLIENLHFLEKPVSIRRLCTRLEMALAQQTTVEADTP